MKGVKSFRKEDVVGKTVIETSGTIRGKVKDVLFDLNGTVTIVVERIDGEDWQVPIRRVTGISDHVVVGSEPTTTAPPVGLATSCKFCGASMTPGERWCPRCGKSQT
jgi:sporulation protein YlmC with PRC-barrel domain